MSSYCRTILRECWTVGDRHHRCRQSRSLTRCRHRLSRCRTLRRNTAYQLRLKWLSSLSHAMAGIPRWLNPYSSLARPGMRFGNGCKTMRWVVPREELEESAQAEERGHEERTRL